MPIIYEVNVSVDAAIIDAYQAWLKDHVAQILALPGFIGASVYRVADASAERAAAHHPHWRDGHPPPPSGWPIGAIPGDRLRSHSRGSLSTHITGTQQ